MVVDSPQRKFALDVVGRLRAAGFEALWAGGCVRDQLLGLAPKDYDVATSATPEQVRQLFGRSRTLELGAAFGVVTVLGPKPAGQIEVATFRSDGAYLDGRHPQSVTFSSAEHDAQRRDFTINGLFYDPLREEVIDYVGGRADLKAKVIRAIGNPHERFGEDKLRMLRAVRFAATFDFEIEPATQQAMAAMASKIVIVSAERIAAEMRRMLIHPRRALAVRLLMQAGLLTAILPEAAVLDASLAANDANQASFRWDFTLRALNALDDPTFATSLALLLREVVHAELSQALDARPGSIADRICRRWKLANEETDVVKHLLINEAEIRAAESLAWPKLQRLLTSPHVAELLAFTSAICRTLEGHDRSIQFCRDKLRLPPNELNPPPLLTGDDLKSLGMRPGPAFRTLLEALRDAQLDKLVVTRDEALAFVQRLHASPHNDRHAD
jgi:poly(A) polymerase